MTTNAILLGLALTCFHAPLPGALAQEPPTAPQPPAPAKTEDELVSEIMLLLGTGPKLPADAELVKSAFSGEKVILLIDELLARFPATRQRDDMLVHKLAMLADLARVQESYLGVLLQTTEDIAESKPTGRLAEQNDYYAIRAFVMAARFENMEEQRRLMGAAERYMAFLTDHPKSEHAPTIYASLVRSLLALDKRDDAGRTFDAMQKLYPADPATRRAAGEMRTNRAIGRPFALNTPFSDGSKIDTAQYTGHVVIVHFWMSLNRSSVDCMREITRVAGNYDGTRLRVESICLDDERTAEKARGVPFQSSATWPQHYESKSMRSDLVLDNGIVELPTCFVIDAKGVLRAVLAGDKTRDLAIVVETLMGESKP